MKDLIAETAPIVESETPGDELRAHYASILLWLDSAIDEASTLGILSADEVKTLGDAAWELSSIARKIHPSSRPQMPERSLKSALNKLNDKAVSSIKG